MATRKKQPTKPQPTGLEASLYLKGSAAKRTGRVVWEMNVYRPHVSGQRTEVIVGMSESPITEADRLLAADGYTVEWENLPIRFTYGNESPRWVGVVVNI